ncbi:Uncharacterized conserved protein [Parasphingorhabdus marina DSM 22363]|uniref:Uncharacterized conserved protein n=1 Tax=Parasphingorhabdus marina DSM 22363 TaxID=1123272 RepID=A0A1N6CMH7_9SPHN|nr:hypothetical protein [Parasphingorhabdus marina]SIN59753.1 Uncharacterized conserved protein [Parasphingorhabdus marina DSM 22363]
MVAYAGSCHCGAVTLDFRSKRTPAELGARSCQCSFCRMHGASWTSDPGGQVDITLAGPVSRYRFGTKTSDFLVCTACGVVPVVTSEITGRFLGVIRVDCLEEKAAFLDAAAPMDLDGELLEARIDRRAERWTPVAIKQEDMH